MKSFAEKVRDSRARLNLSQKQLAEKSGIAYRSIVNYEAGHHAPYPAQLYKLATALGVSTEYLKNDDIDDPTYGLGRMEYVEEVRRKEGIKEAMSLEELLSANQALFAGGTVSEDAKDAYFQAVMRAYLDSKERARQLYGHSQQ